MSENHASLPFLFIETANSGTDLAYYAEEETDEDCGHMTLERQTDNDQIQKIKMDRKGGFYVNTSFERAIPEDACFVSLARVQKRIGLAIEYIRKGMPVLDALDLAATWLVLPVGTDPNKATPKDADEGRLDTTSITDDLRKRLENLK